MKFRIGDACNSAWKYRIDLEGEACCKGEGEDADNVRARGVSRHSASAVECQIEASHASLEFTSFTSIETRNEIVWDCNWVTCPRGGKLEMLETPGPILVLTVSSGVAGDFCLGMFVERNSGTKS